MGIYTLPSSTSERTVSALAPQSLNGIYTAFLERVKQHPHKPAFELDGGSTITYSDLLTDTQRIAHLLTQAGVTPGDRVVCQVKKSVRAVAAYLAVLQIGAIYLPLNTAYTGTELQYFLDDAEPAAVVVDPADASAVRDMTSHAAIFTLDAAGSGTISACETRLAAITPVTAEDPAAILYTSGTTGRSKGAVLTHSNLASNCRALLDAWEFTGEDRLIHALPIFHIHGLFVALNMSLTAGATMLWRDSFDVDGIIDRFDNATVLMGVPTFYTRLLASERLDRSAVANMRLFVSGSAPLLRADFEAFYERTEHHILERYGMTETGMNTTNPYRGERRPGSVGKPLPGVEVTVADSKTGEPLPDGEIGSIEVRGPNVFDRYWHNPEKTREEKRDDGFFITGDQGFYDADGYLHISGRSKDMIISGGFNVYPKEVEQLLDEHPDVAESAVIGVPHADLGESVVAVLVTANGRVPLESELTSLLADQLARYKQPRAYRVVEQLPRNVMGKVQKAQLREQFTDMLTA